MKTLAKLAILLLAGTTLAACQEEENSPQLPPRPVLSVVAQPEPSLSLSLSGTVEARVETEFGFRILGEEMVEGLVLVGPDLFRDRQPPLLRVVEFRIDIENQPSEAEEPMPDHLADREFG